jgi:AraC-like DNA-binding protein
MKVEQSKSGTGMLTAVDGRRFQESPVSPRICVAPARAMYVGPGLQLAPHLNVAATIAVALAEPFQLRIWRAPAGWSEWQSAACALIPSETLHHLKSCGPMAFLYLDPLTDRRQPLTQAQLESGRIHLQGTAQRIGIQDAFAGFGLQPKVPSDARIARVVQEVERRPDAFGRIQEAAELACLSPSRFRARFDAEVGLPFRRYRLWRRMALVMRAIAEGKSLTAAALEAGFSSSAHLSSSFKRMFGLSASEVIALGVAIDVSEDRVLSTASAAQADSEGRHALAL